MTHSAHMMEECPRKNPFQPDKDQLTKATAVPLPLWSLARKFRMPGGVSQSAPKPIDSVNWSVRSLPAPLSQLSSLARDFVSIELSKYLESEDFISDNSSILAQNEINALIAEALTAEKAS